MGVVVALAGGDVVVATHAGAALAAGSHPSAVIAAATRPPTSTPRAPRTTTTVPRPRRVAVVRRPAVVAPKRRTAPQPVKPKPTPPRPDDAFTVAAAAVPTTCAGVIASIVWPSTWHMICAGPRSGILGLTSPTGTTTLYVRSGESAAFMRVVALHESGHAWDFARLDANKIAQWCAARGCDAAHFFSGGARGSGWSEPGGAEDWAASWDACHGGEYHRSYLGLAPPTAAQCALQNTLVGYPG